MIEITETAARKIRTLMAKQGIDEGGLRVGVKGGGCSGLSYTFAWERQARLGDEVFEGPSGAKIFVDKKSLLFLNGTFSTTTPTSSARASCSTTRTPKRAAAAEARFGA